MGQRFGGGLYNDPLPAPDLLGPSEIVDCKPALIDARQLDRIVAAPFGSTPERELTQFNATSYREVPLLLYRLGPGCVFGGQLVTRDAVRWLSKRPSYADLAAPMVEVERLMLANSELGLAYFSHWLQDDCVAYEAIRETGTILSLPRPAWPDCAVYEALFGQKWEERPLIAAREIVLQADIAYSRSKADRVARLRGRMRARLEARGTGRIVFIDRGARGERRMIANAPELRAAFEGQGIRIVTPEGGSREMVAEMLDADIVIGVEGSHMGHAEFAIRDGGGVIILQPPTRFWAQHHEWSRVLGMTTGVVVGTQQGEDFRIEPGEVFDMVERVLAEI